MQKNEVSDTVTTYPRFVNRLVDFLDVRKLNPVVKIVLPCVFCALLVSEVFDMQNDVMAQWLVIAIELSMVVVLYTLFIRGDI